MKRSACRRRVTKRRLLAFDVCPTLVMLVLVSVVLAADPARYRVVSGRKIEELERGLRDSAGQGYRLIGAAVDGPKYLKCGVVHFLLERLPDDQVHPEYLVIDGSYALIYRDGLDRLQEAGARGFRVPDQGVMERPCENWGSMTWEIVVVLERTDPGARLEYVVERFPRSRLAFPTPGAWPALAARVAEGYRLVAFTTLDGAILSRQEGARRVEGIEPDRFLLISKRGKKKLARRLDAALAEGFRFAENLYAARQGFLLLEKVAATDRGYEYRILPGGARASPLMSELGAEGFRVHRAAGSIMERELPVENAYEYRTLEFQSAAELTERMEGSIAEGWSFLHFRSSRKSAFTVLLERPRPDENRR